MPNKTVAKIYWRTDGGRIEEMNQTQQPLWLVNVLFCYEGEKQTGNESKRKKHSNSKEAYTDGSKSTSRKVGYATVFTDTRRSLHSHS